MKPLFKLCCFFTLLGGSHILQAEQAIKNTPDSLLTIYFNGDDSVRYDAVQKIIVYYRNVDIDSAKHYIKILYGLSTNNNLQRLGQSQILDGSIYHRQNLYDSAELLYNMALKTFTAGKYAKGISSCLNNLGALYQEQGDYKRAGQYLFKYLKLADSIGDKKDLSTAYVNIGLLLHEQEQYTEALKYYNQALKIKREINDKRGEALLYNNIGITNYFLEDYDNVLASFKHALAIFREINDLRGQAMPYFNIGEIYFEIKEDFEKALYYYKKSYDIECELGDIIGQSSSLNKMGVCYSAMKNYKQALIVQQRALQMLRKINTPRQLSSVLEDLSITYENLGYYKNALNCYKEHVTIHDSLTSKNNIQQITVLKEQYESDKKDREILRLNNEKTIQELELKSHLKDIRLQNILLIIATIFLILITMVVYLLLRLYRQSKRLNNALVAKNIVIGQKNEQLSIMNENIKKTSEIKEVFLSNITNDLKTPLAVIGSFSTHLLTMKTHDSQKYYLEQIRASSNNLQILLNDLITHTKINAGILNLENLPFKISNIVNYLKEIYESKAAEKKISLKIDCLSGAGKTIVSDQIRLIQICSNLLNNALKNTLLNGNIECHFSITDSSLEIKLNGQGFNTEDTTPQYPLHDTELLLHTDHPHNNLSLTIVSYLVNLFNGTMINEKGENQNCTLIINIPVKTEETVEVSMPTIGNTKSNIFPNVLIICQNPDDSTVLMDILNAHDQNAIVDCVDDCDKAAFLLRKNNYNLSLIDISITTNTGLSVADFFNSKINSKKALGLIIGCICDIAWNIKTSDFDNIFHDFLHKPFIPQNVISFYDKAKSKSKHIEPKNNNFVQPSPTILSSDIEKMQDVLDFFEYEIRQQLFKLNIAIKEGAKQKMKSTISFIKNGICYIDDVELTTTITNLEQAIIKNEKSVIEHEFSQLQKSCSKVEAWLKESINSDSRKH